MGETLSDALTALRNAKRAGKSGCELRRFSRLVLAVLEVASRLGYLSYSRFPNKVSVTFKRLNEIKAIRPRFYVKAEEIERYVRRYLPSRLLGHVLISTSKGLLSHQEALEKHLGGALIAYLY